MNIIMTLDIHFQLVILKLFREKARNHHGRLVITCNRKVVGSNPGVGY